MGQVENRDVIVCRGCHGNIVLLDNKASTKRGIRSVDAAMKKLLKAFG